MIIINNLKQKILLINIILFMFLINNVFLSNNINNYYQLFTEFSFYFVFKYNDNKKEKFNNIFFNKLF